MSNVSQTSNQSKNTVKLDLKNSKEEGILLGK